MQFMKQRKAEKKDGETVKLSHHHGYASALLRASELADELKEHRDELSTLKMQANRIGSDARGFINNQAIALPASMDQEIARQVIQSGDVMAKVAAARGTGVCADLYSRLHFLDASDLEFVKTLDDERAAVQVLECAVKLHSAEVLKQKDAAIVEIAYTLKPRRERIAREVARALTQLRAALADEQALGDELAAQDIGFAHRLHPAIFPVRALLDPELLAWIADAQAAGLMDSNYRHVETGEEAVEANA